MGVATLIFDKTDLKPKLVKINKSLHIYKGNNPKEGCKERV
jgi:hypothetical protein